MKLLPSINVYKSGNNELVFLGQTIGAISYGWWKYVAMDGHGNVIFNRACYSVTTNKHQSDTASVLRRLNIKIGLELFHTKVSLSNVRGAVCDEIEYLERKLKELDEAMARKGSHRAKNEERAKQCAATSYRIKDLQAYLLDGRLPAAERYSCEWTAESKAQHALELEKYFLKPNGVVQRNELQAFLKHRLHMGAVPESLTGLQALLGKHNTLAMLQYQYANDLERMLPGIDTDEHTALLKAVKRYKVDVNNLTTLDLDKLHVVLANLLNKKVYEPRGLEPLPTHPHVLSLVGNEHLTIIDTVKALRAEGRRQSHCIGGADYIRLCKLGYQALNYRGFTFLLTPLLEIREAKGKHNSPVPGSVYNEFAMLIAK